MAVTIKDIAKVAGVSHTTVSRALKGHQALSSYTIERICRIADELGYVPNTVARGLKTKRSRMLGLIIRRTGDPYFSEVQQGIEAALNQEDYCMMLASCNKDQNRESKIVQMMSEHRVDGVIICSSELSNTQQKKLEQFGVPTVLIDNQANAKGFLSIRHDDVIGSQTIVNHLLELGHKRIAYLGNANAGKTNSKRLEGYYAGLATAGIVRDEALIIQAPNGFPECGAEFVKPLLEMKDPPTALVCYNDLLAIGAMQSMKAAGWILPDDCSITGFDNIRLGPFVEPALTTISQPKFQIGYEAARLMLDYLASQERGEVMESLNKVVRGSLIVRQSTAICSH